MTSGDPSWLHLNNVGYNRYNNNKPSPVSPQRGGFLTIPHHHGWLIDVFCPHVEMIYGNHSNPSSIVSDTYFFWISKFTNHKVRPLGDVFHSPKHIIPVRSRREVWVYFFWVQNENVGFIGRKWGVNHQKQRLKNNGFGVNMIWPVKSCGYGTHHVTGWWCGA